MDPDRYDREHSTERFSDPSRQASNPWDARRSFNERMRTNERRRDEPRYQSPNPWDARRSSNTRARPEPRSDEPSYRSRAAGVRHENPLDARRSTMRRNYNPHAHREDRNSMHRHQPHQTWADSRSTNENQVQERPNERQNNSLAMMMTQETKRILIEELGYRRADVKRLKFDKARGLVEQRIRCPKEGVPESWCTQ